MEIAPTLPPLVSVQRQRFDNSPWYGYLVGESPSLIVLHQVSDRYSLDGYRILRRADVSDMAEQFDKCPLISTALGLKRQLPHRPVGLDLSTMRDAMASAQRLYDALVIHREAVASDEVEVGTVRMTSEVSYVLRWLSPQATWEDDNRRFRYRDVTTLEFGCEYEQTLAWVARALAHPHGWNAPHPVDR